MVSSFLKKLKLDSSKKTSRHNHEPKHKAGHMSASSGIVINNTSVLVTTRHPPFSFSRVNPAPTGWI